MLDPIDRSRDGKLSPAYTHTSEPNPKLNPMMNSSTPTNPKISAGPSGEYGDQHDVGDDHHGDAGQQDWAPAQPVDENQRGTHRRQAGDLNQRRQPQQREIAREAHGGEYPRAVVDDRVDAGDLDEKAEGDHEDGGAQVGPTQHLGHGRR